jgi:hypothetical protein
MDMTVSLFLNRRIVALRTGIPVKIEIPVAMHGILLARNDLGSVQTKLLLRRL